MSAVVVTVTKFNRINCMSTIRTFVEFIGTRAECEDFVAINEGRYHINGNFTVNVGIVEVGIDKNFI